MLKETGGFRDLSLDSLEWINTFGWFRFACSEEKEG
jgi:hypothetical protein